MNDIVKAQEIKNLTIQVPIIKVEDEKTNIAALENIQYAKMKKFEIQQIVKPIKEEYYRPWKNITNIETKVLSEIDNWIKSQEKESIEYQKQIKAQLEAENQKVDALKTKSEWVSSQFKPEMIVVVTNIAQLCETLLSTGQIAAISSIFKINESELKKYIKALGVDKYPGVDIKFDYKITTRK